MQRLEETVKNLTSKIEALESRLASVERKMGERSTPADSLSAWGLRSLIIITVTSLGVQLWSTLF